MTLARGDLPQYVILRNQAEFPGKYVVRERRSVGNEEILAVVPYAVADSLDEARAAVQGTDCMLCLPPALTDPKEVVETWV